MGHRASAGPAARIASGPACHTPRVTGRSARHPRPATVAPYGTGRQAPLDVAIVLATVDPYGWPHPALVSYAEVLALDPVRLRLGLHAGSRSSRHLRESGRATLVFADGELCCYVKVEGLAARDAERARPRPVRAGGP